MTTETTLLICAIRWERCLSYLVDSLASSSINNKSIKLLFVSDCSTQNISHGSYTFFSKKQSNNKLPLTRLGSEISLSSFKKIIVKNYIEPGNILITQGDSNLRPIYIAQLGDTHHIDNALSYASHFLDQQVHDCIFSLSNPMHAHLFSDKVKISIAIPPFITEQETIIPPYYRNTYEDIGFCISLSQHQYNRTFCAKKLIRSSHLRRIKFYHYLTSRSKYIRQLQSLNASIIPSLSGQYSPQINFALANGVLPIVDSNLSSSQYWKKFYHVKNATLTFEQFLNCSPEDLSDLIRSKHSHLRDWQLLSRKFLKYYKDEYEFLLSISEHNFAEDIIRFPLVTKDTAQSAILTIDKIFKYAKLGHQFTILANPHLQFLTNDVHFLIYESVVQIPHLLIKSFPFAKYTDHVQPSVEYLDIGSSLFLVPVI